MRISQRMYLALLPAVLGVFTVAALAYWGQYAHAAPEWLVAIAVIATLASVTVAWRNAQYVARRVERVAAKSTSPSRAAGDTPDELETIESAVHHLTTAVGEAEATRRAEESAHRNRQREYADLLALVAADALHKLDEVRLPLHILLENHFGDMNENQEEMLGAARNAAEQAGEALQRLQQIAELDRGAVPMRRDSVRSGDLIAGVLPSLVAQGEQRGVGVTAEVAPALPSVPGDRGRLQMALELILHDCVARTADGGHVRIDAEPDKRWVRVDVRHGSGEANRISQGLGTRVIAAHGGSVSEEPGKDGELVTRIQLMR
jgi:signal transduction histidine kinase